MINTYLFFVELSMLIYPFLQVCWFFVKLHADTCMFCSFKNLTGSITAIIYKVRWQVLHCCSNDCLQRFAFNYVVSWCLQTVLYLVMLSNPELWPVHLYIMSNVGMGYELIKETACGLSSEDLTIVFPLFSCSQLLQSLFRCTTTTQAPPAVSMSHKLQYRLLEQLGGISRYIYSSVWPSPEMGCKFQRNWYLLLQSTIGLEMWLFQLLPPMWGVGCTFSAVSNVKGLK